MATVCPDPAKPPCRCGGMWYAKGMCRRCYWQDYNAKHPDRQVHYNHTKRKGRRHRPPPPPPADPPRRRRRHPLRTRKPDGWLRRQMEQQGRCGNRWCHARLEQVVARDGAIMLLPCELCSRLARGLCYACNLPLDPVKDVHHNRNGKRPSRWHMDARHGCYMNRIRDRKLARRRERYHDDPALRHDELTQRRLRRIRDLKESRPFRRRRERALRAAAGATPRAIAPRKFRPCPDGCGGLISYRTKPPARCDACWDRLAQRLSKEVMPAPDGAGGR